MLLKIRADQRDEGSSHKGWLSSENWTASDEQRTATEGFHLTGGKQQQYARTYPASRTSPVETLCITGE